MKVDRTRDQMRTEDIIILAYVLCLLHDFCTLHVPGSKDKSLLSNLPLLDGANETVELCSYESDT